MKSFDHFLPPQPYHLSTYAGFVPGYITSFGKSYGRFTHDSYFDEEVKLSKVPVFTDLKKYYNDATCTVEEEDSIKKRCENNLNCKYKNDIISGYTGYIPQYNFVCGKHFAKDATRGINNFLKLQQRRSMKTDEKLHNDNKYTHPFIKDEEGEQLFKEQYTPKLPITPTDTTYFLENGNPHKKFMAGYGGHVPSLLFEFGQSYTPATKKALNNFTDQHTKNKLFRH